MIKCPKCKRVTKKGEPTGLIKKYRSWNHTEKKEEGEQEQSINIEHKDLSQTSQACMRCSNG